MTIGAEISEPAPVPDDALLRAESERLGLPFESYRAMTPRERGLAKARFMHRVKSEARRYGIDPDEYAKLGETGREQALKQAADRIREERHHARHPTPAAKPDDAEDDDDDESEEIPVYTAADDVPATDPDPERRDGMTIGPIVEREAPEDRVGRRYILRNLRDVYDKYPIGDGEHFIHVERVKPPAFQGLPVAGYVGDIRQRISMAQFQRYYGGTKYELQVYGPDPSGRHDDATGMPKIKALTDPFEITVPNLPPNIRALPAAMSQPEDQTMQPVQPGMPWNPYSGPMPATTADAAMFKTSTDFASKMVEQANKEKAEAERRADDARRGDSNGGNRLIDVMAKQHEDAMALMRAEQGAKERAWAERLVQESEANKTLRADVESLRTKMDDRRGGPSEAVELLKVVNPARSASDDIARVSESFKQQLDRAKEAHAEALASLRARHEDELKRADDRQRDELSRIRSNAESTEQFYKKMLEEERQKRLDRERELKDEVDRRMQDEQKIAETRVRETKERYEDRIKDLDKAHERELRGMKDNFDTKLATSEATLKIELSSVRERLDETKSELEEARTEAREAGDPAAVIEKAEKQAKALGFKKKDEEKLGWDLIAGGVGKGIEQAIGSIKDWGPDMMAKMRQPPAQAPGQQPNKALPNQQQGAAAARRRSVAWATEGSVPAAGPPANIPAQPINVQPSPAQPAQGQQVPTGATEVPPTPAAATTQPAATGAPTNPLGRIFADEAIVSFVQEIERAIDGGIPPQLFATNFVALYRDASQALIQFYKPDQLLGFVKQTRPDSAALRRDGKVWVESLWGALQEIHTAPAPAAQPN